MTCHDIIKVYLQKNGYDGLCQPFAECGCGLNDFAPCGEGPYSHCQPARARIVTEPDGEWNVGDIMYVPVEEYVSSAQLDMESLDLLRKMQPLPTEEESK